MNNKRNFRHSLFVVPLKGIIILLFLLGTFTVANAQSGMRFAFINLEYILQNIPDYAKAQKELDDYSLKLQEDIDMIYREVAEMRSKFNADKVFLTATMREQRELEIAEKENKAHLLQQRYFGAKGELFAKREELVKPLQDEVLQIVKDIAKEQNLSLIIDISADNSIIYYDPKLDKSKTVLRKLGYTIKED